MGANPDDVGTCARFALHRLGGFGSDGAWSSFDASYRKMVWLIQRCTALYLSVYE
jgi:hypothetical protein